VACGALAQSRRTVDEFTAISYAVQDSVATITLDRPDELNALGYDLSSGGFDVYARARERGTDELGPGDIPRDSGGLIALRVWFLPRAVGISRALEWSYSGRIFYTSERAPAADPVEGAASFLEKRRPEFPLTVSAHLPQPVPPHPEPPFDEERP
jgi:hypothetical protein